MARILLVEDSPTQAQHFTLVLEDAGFAVETAADARHAFNRAERGGIDLVLTDLFLPGDSGLDLCRRLKDDPRLRHTPVVLITRSANPVNLLRGLEAGADDFMTKDREPADMVGRILRALSPPAPAAGGTQHVRFLDQEFELATERDRLLNVLLSSFEDLLQLDRRNQQELARRRQAEEELLSARRDLEARVLERTAELARANEGLRSEVAEHRRTAEALRLRDRAIEAFPQGVVITDASEPDHPIIYANPQFEQTTGYSRGEALGRNCRFLQGPGTDPDAVTRIRATLREERPCRVELLNYRKDGTPFWNALSIAPILDAAGKVTHFVGVQTDVTEFKRLEEQLRQAQKMEALGRVAGGVAHDFNNLLTIINGYADVVFNMLPAGEPPRELLGLIRKAGERSAALTRQLLAFSRKQMLESRVLDLNALVGETETLLRRVIGADVELTARLEPALGWVKADPGQLEQILMNLAINARDAMPRGGNLTIETANVELGRDDPRAAAGRYVLLTVSDTGCGMPPELQARIFEPFFTTKELGRGTGLGLATVHGIVRQASGHIEVASEVGRGTEFRVYLPRVEAAVPSSSRSSPGLTKKPRGTETLLLVEDDEGVRQFAITVLRGSGYTVLEAGGGKEALRVSGQHGGSIDLLLTDIVMPGMLGPEVADRLADMRPGLKVLYLSGHPADAVFPHTGPHAEAAFLQKPFAVDDLARKVREVLDEGCQGVPGRGGGWHYLQSHVRLFQLTHRWTAGRSGREELERSEVHADIQLTARDPGAVGLLRGVRHPREGELRTG